MEQVNPTRMELIKKNAQIKPAEAGKRSSPREDGCTYPGVLQYHGICL